MNIINTLYSRNLKTCNLTSSEDPDEMQQNAVLSVSLHAVKTQMKCIKMLHLSVPLPAVKTHMKCSKVLYLSESTPYM